jgi:hypothetical protein
VIRLANIDPIEIDLGDIDLKVGNRVEIHGTVDIIKGNLVEITTYGMTEPRVITGARTATLCITSIEVMDG